MHHGVPPLFVGALNWKESRYQTIKDRLGKSRIRKNDAAIKNRLIYWQEKCLSCIVEWWKVDTKQGAFWLQLCKIEYVSTYACMHTDV